MRTRKVLSAALAGLWLAYFGGAVVAYNFVERRAWGSEPSEEGLTPFLRALAWPYLISRP